MTDGAFLSWIADRLVFVHGEPENVDFILKLRKLALEAANREQRSPVRPFVIAGGKRTDGTPNA